MRKTFRSFLYKISFVGLLLLSLYSALQILVYGFPVFAIHTPTGIIPLPQPYVLGLPLIQAVKQIWMYGIVSIVHVSMSTSFGYDFGFFDYAFRQVWYDHGQNLYNNALQQTWMKHWHYSIIKANQYVYPPQFAVLFSYFALLPFKVAALVWNSLGLLFTWISAFLLATLAANGRSAPLLRVLIVAMVMSYYGVFNDLTISNANWLILFLLSCFYVLHVRYKKSSFAGIALGLAVLCKVTPVMIIAYFILKKEWNLVLSALCTIVVITIGTGLIIGFHPIIYYVFHLGAMSAQSMTNGPAPYNISLIGLLQLLPAFRFAPMSDPIVLMLYYTYIVIMAAAIYGSLRKVQHPLYDTALSSISVLAFSPLIETTHTVVLIITMTSLLAIVSGAIRHDDNHTDYTQIPRWITVLPVILLSIVMLYSSFGFLLFITNYIVPMWWPLSNLYWDPFLLYTTFILVLMWPWFRPKDLSIFHRYT